MTDLSTDLGNLATADAGFRQEVADVGQQRADIAQGNIDFAQKQGDAGVQRAQDFAAGQQPFTQSPPTDQINTIMSGAPWLFALTALGGKVSKTNGLAMLQGLNGMSKGILVGDEEATNQAWQKYKSSYEKWRANADQQFRVFQELSDAYGKSADAQLKARLAAQSIMGDVWSTQLQVDDPARIVDLQSKITDSHAKLLTAYASMKKAGSGGGMPEGWTQDDVDFYARQQIAGDTTWRTGLGRTAGGAQIIKAVDRRVPELAHIYGISPEEASTTKDMRKALDATLKQRSQYLGAAEQFVGNFKKQAQLVEKYLQPGVGGATPVLNRWIQAGRKSVVGDEDVTALDTAIRGLAREHQRIVTGVTSNAQMHVAAQQTADDLLNRDMTAGMIRSSMKVMLEEANNAVKSGTDEVGLIRGQLADLGIAGKLDEKKPTSQYPVVTSREQFEKLKPGDHFVDADGKEWVKPGG